MDQKNLYDVVIIGGGPAGLTAAIYLARARYRVVVLEKESFGGQITITSEVVNYPGIERISGKDLTESMRNQAQAFGAEFMLAEATSLDMSGDIKIVHTSRGDLNCFGVLLATGAHPRMVGFDGEEKFRGRGVAYCATCDGEFFTGKPIFVIGGGFAAAEESIFLTKYATKVTIMMRGENFRCAESTANEARLNPKIEVLNHTEVVRVEGENSVTKIVYRNNQTQAETVFEDPNGFGVFVFAGYTPATKLIEGIAELENGYVVTDRNQKTSCDGLYSEGDVCIKNLRQVVTAVGDGAIAATELEKLAASMQKKLNLKPNPPVTRIQQASHEESEIESKSESKSSELFDSQILAQLDAVFAKMENPLTLKLSLDSREVSEELQAYIEEMASRTDKLTVEIDEKSARKSERPCVKIYRDGKFTGLAFHGVPGGHEFTSFVLGLYNAAGSGQAIDAESKSRIESIKESTDIKILVSLSCTMCPELVMAAQKIASMNPEVTAEVFDINHFEKLREKYNVMSVPCLVLNDDQISFGKKNISQLLDFIESHKRDA